ncbi:MAG: hypothetical protein HYU52_00715 [Acidobacteria bacterium]|nr:hypothetical protein [Acidobacteriota bacterium]
MTFESGRAPAAYTIAWNGLDAIAKERFLLIPRFAPYRSRMSFDHGALVVESPSLPGPLPPTFSGPIDLESEFLSRSDPIVGAASEVIGARAQSLVPGIVSSSILRSVLPESGVR